MESPDKPPPIVIKSRSLIMELPDRIPPIVIKSGSLVIESDVEFDRKGREATYEGAIGTAIPLQSVLVNRINEQSPDRLESKPVIDPNGHEIRIWLQAYVEQQPGRPGEWLPRPENFPANPDVVIKGQAERNRNRIIVTFPTDDTDSDVDRKKTHPVRNNRLILLKTAIAYGNTRQGTEYRIFRFGKVEIINKARTRVYESSSAKDGDEFTISVWNEVGSDGDVNS